MLASSARGERYSQHRIPALVLLAGILLLLITSVAHGARIAVDPQGPTGLLLSAPGGVRLLSPLDQGANQLTFGPTDECRIWVDPEGPTGLLLRDPYGIRVLSPQESGLNQILFGPTDLCTITVDEFGVPGLLLRDPNGVRILNPDAEGNGALIFGPTDECRIEAGPGPSGLGTGLMLVDPRGVVLLNPTEGEGPSLSFDEAGECRIRAVPQAGLIFDDPNGFIFKNDTQVDGTLSAQEFVQASSIRHKQDIMPINGALDKIQRLQGVSFNWKPEQGGAADLGFIGEEVAKVLPELVTWFGEERGSVQGVKYANIVAVAVEGIKEQQKTIESLSEQNKGLRQDLAELEAQLAALSAQVSVLANADGRWSNPTEVGIGEAGTLGGR